MRPTKEGLKLVLLYLEVKEGLKLVVLYPAVSIVV